MFRLNVLFFIVPVTLVIQMPSQSHAQMNEPNQSYAQTHEPNKSYAQTNEEVQEKPNPLSYDQGSSLGEMLAFEKNMATRLTHSSSKAMHLSDQNENKVLAIYGVGKKLMTDVEFQGQRYQFKQGQSQAIQSRILPRQPTPTLITIKPPCVRLKFQRVEHHFCLAGALP